MNPDTIFSILLYCDINTIQSFNCIGIKLPNYFWHLKFKKDGFILNCKPDNTITWIKEYKIVQKINQIINEKISSLIVEANINRQAVMTIGLKQFENISSIFPVELHKPTILGPLSASFKYKVDILIVNDILMISYTSHNLDGYKSKSSIINMKELKSILFNLYYHDIVIN